jgi:hypothetical protein
MKTDDLYTIILKIYYTLYTIKLKICTQRFYYSSSKFSEFIQVPSTSVAGLCLFAKGEVKNLSKVDLTSLVEWPDRSCLLLYVIARIH